MESEYLIQVLHKPSGTVAHSWAPGLEVEKQFETELADRVREKGVGIARTEAHVITDVVAALRELLYDLKRRV